MNTKPLKKPKTERIANVCDGDCVAFISYGKISQQKSPIGSWYDGKRFALASTESPRRTISIAWPQQMTDHFIEHNSAAHVHRVVRDLRWTTACSSPLTTSLADRHCEG
ncbi:hypothetical protein CGZ80_02380 [Rhodopirellula sp. MGV]|nr:hypothetical protein CGZ80_02380 [Rhodopirellula sp. MGV]